MQYLNNRHKCKGLDPVANAFAGTVYTDIIRVAGQGLLFTIYKGVGASGTSTITVEACSTVGAAATAAVPFIYRVSTTGDTWGDWTAATTAGFTTTAGSSQMYEIYVDAQEIAQEGYAFARLAAVEVVASAVLGGILVEVVEPHYQPSGTALA